MRFCTFVNLQQELKVGVVVGDNKVVVLTDYQDMKDVIQRYQTNKEDIEDKVEHADNFYPLTEIQLKAPVLNPGKLIFIGLNYRDHAEEAGIALPDSPILFTKFANSLVGSGEKVVITRETSRCDYEAELAFVIGKLAKDVSEEDALDYVFGYTACNDVSARDLQFGGGGQWTRGKTIDTFAPMGPVLVTADEITDPGSLGISCKVNGELRQNSNTEQLIFNISQILSFLSRTMTLEPGDIISTGTPSGVALGMDNPPWLKNGDVVEVEIEGIGILRNKMIQEN